MKKEKKRNARRSREYPGVEWTGGAGVFIAVDGNRCTGCGNCVKVCLGGCYEISKKKARIRNLALCMECGSCWYVCPHEAVLFRWPKGGTGFRTSWG